MSMTDYHDAPATKMLDIHCAICGEDLLDSKSVEYGMGPSCRSKHGFMGKNAPNVSEEARKEGNRIVYSIACGLPGEHLMAAITRLREIGFDTLANVLIDRKVAVMVEDHGDWLHVRTPYKEETLTAWRNIPGRKYNREEKINQVPNYPNGRLALWNLLKQYYAGEYMQSSRGLTVIPR
jgi:hypothetical protein